MKLGLLRLRLALTVGSDVAVAVAVPGGVAVGVNVAVAVARRDSRGIERAARSSQARRELFCFFFTELAFELH